MEGVACGWSNGPATNAEERHEGNTEKRQPAPPLKEGPSLRGSSSRLVPSPSKRVLLPTRDAVLLPARDIMFSYQPAALYLDKLKETLDLSPSGLRSRRGGPAPNSKTGRPSARLPSTLRPISREGEMRPISREQRRWARAAELTPISRTELEDCWSRTHDKWSSCHVIGNLSPCGPPGRPSGGSPAAGAGWAGECELRPCAKAPGGAAASQPLPTSRKLKHKQGRDGAPADQKCAVLPRCELPMPSTPPGRRHHRSNETAQDGLPPKATTGGDGGGNSPRRFEPMGGGDGLRRELRRELSVGCRCEEGGSLTLPILELSDLEEAEQRPTTPWSSAAASFLERPRGAGGAAPWLGRAGESFSRALTGESSREQTASSKEEMHPLDGSVRSCQADFPMSMCKVVETEVATRRNSTRPMTDRAHRPRLENLEGLGDVRCGHAQTARRHHGGSSSSELDRI